MNPSYFLRVIIVLDVAFGNIFFLTTRLETLSAKSYRCRNKTGWGLVRGFLDSVFFWDKEVIDGRVVNHCEWCYLWERERRARWNQEG